MKFVRTMQQFCDRAAWKAPRVWVNYRAMVFHIIFAQFCNCLVLFCSQEEKQKTSFHLTFSQRKEKHHYNSETTVLNSREFVNSADKGTLLSFDAPWPQNVHLILHPTFSFPTPVLPLSSSLIPVHSSHYQSSNSMSLEHLQKWEPGAQKWLRLCHEKR